MVDQVFVGREHELAQLHTFLDRAIAGHGQVCFVTGEAGAGKTFLVERFLTLTAKRRPEVRIARGRCSERFGDREGYLPFIEALGRLLTSPDQKSVERKVLAAVSETAPSWLEAVPVVGQALRASFETAQALRDEFGSGTGAQARAPDQERMLQEYTGLLTRLAQQSPLLLFLDDLHWSDAASVDLLSHLSSRLGGSPILLLGTYRPSDVDVGRDGEPHPLRKAVQNMRRYDACQEISLDHFDRGECADLIAAEFPDNDFPASLSNFLFRRSGGTALFITEMLRLLRDQGYVEQRNSTWHLVETVGGLDLPRSVESVVAMRIDRLEEDLHRVLQYASVEGERFLSTSLAKVSEIDELTLEEQLDTAERVHRFVEVEGELEIGWDLATLYKFAHALFQQTLYDGLRPKQRALLHRRVGLALEELYGESALEIASSLAVHFTEGRLFDKAFDYSLEAGHQAQRLYAPRGAIGHYERARRLLERVDGDSLEGRLAIEEGLGDMRTLVAEHDAAFAHYERARTLLADAPEASAHPASLCRKTAVLHERKGEYDTAFAWLERGLTALNEDSALETARVRLAGAGLHSRQGKHREALTWCQQALELAQQGDAPADLAHATYLMGTVYGHLGETAEEITYAQRSLDLYQELGDRVGQANALNNLGIAYKETGDWQKAIDCYRRGIDIGEQLGDVHGVAKFSNNLGNVLLWQGDLEGAAQAYRRSLGVWEEIDFPIGVALCWSNLGRVWIERGDWAKAVDYLERSEGLFSEIESDLFLPEVYRRLAEAHLGRGDVHEAQRFAKRSVALAAELDMALEKSISLRVLAQVHLADEELGPAEALLMASLRVPEEQGNRYRMAQTLRQLGRLYRARARSGDAAAAAKAESVLRRAQSIFAELGAERDLAKVQEVLP